MGAVPGLPEEHIKDISEPGLPEERIRDISEPLLLGVIGLVDGSSPSVPDTIFFR
jgi:hypothetical protein